MSDQQWGGRPATGPWRQQGYPQGGFGQAYGQQALGRPAPGYAPQGGGFGGAPRGPRRRSGGAGTVLLIGLVLLAVFALLGFVASGLGSAGNDSDVAYQNDDYRVPPPDLDPPPLPVPDTYEQAEQTILDSPFYDQSVPAPVRCDAEPINISTASDAQLEDHFTEAVECLVRVWEPPVTGADLVIVRPSVTVYGAKMTTKCGTSGVNAFYCAADQQVYFSNQLDDALPIISEERWAADVVIAHEFGHALQARTGILISAKALGQDSGDAQTDLVYSRRLETQADCFSGMYLRAVSASLGIEQSDLQGIEDTYRAVGDDAVSGDGGIVGNHGLARSRVFWGDTGIDSSSVGACNTFTAPQSQVR